MQPTSTTIEVPYLAPGLNGPQGLIRMHYQAYKQMRDKWVWLIRSEAPRAGYSKCRIRVTRYAQGPFMDPDNLVSTAKLPLDALRRAGVIKDDDPLSVVSLEVLQKRVGRRADRKTVIEISEVAAEVKA